MRALLDVVMILLQIGILVLVVQAIMSWLFAFKIIQANNPTVIGIWRTLNQITEPVLRPVRNFLPKTSGIDLAPMAVILIIFFLQRFIAYYVYPNVF